MLVLIIEDDDSIAEPLAKGLDGESYDVERRDRGEPALNRVKDGTNPAPFAMTMR